MIKVVVAGAGGRMGGRLISLIGESKSLRLAGAIEKKGHPAVGRDAGEVAGGARLGGPIGGDLTTPARKGDGLVVCLTPQATPAADESMGRPEKVKGLMG